MQIILIHRLKIFFEDSQKMFYFLLALSLITILFTYPFMRYPYDIYYHLIHIDKFYDVSEAPNDRFLWHFLWAKIFYFFSIPNSEIFFRAKIIHVLQTYLAFFAVFFFSKVIIKNVFNQINKIILNYLSLWSVIIWFSIFATFSVHYQLAWSLWYSVNYQITLPLFWYMTALTLILFLEETSIQKKIFFIIQILLISRFILQVHSMEYLYYLMHLMVFGIIYIDKVYCLVKKYFYIAISLGITIIYFAKKYQPEQSKLFNYLEIDKLPLLYHDIIRQGHLLVGDLNRANASINELMVLIFYLGIIIALIVLRNRLLNVAQFVNLRNFIFIIVTSMFVLLPLYVFSAGLLGIITKTLSVHRFYYSSSIFILLPVFVYYLWYLKDHKNISILKINISLVLIVSSVWFYSKYYTPNQVYYKNVKSIKNSFFERRIGFHLSKKEIILIGDKIQIYEKGNKTNKKSLYYARPDIAFVIKYIYRKKVFWEGRYPNPEYIKLYNKSIKNKEHKKYYRILFEIPSEFPKYERYK